MSPLPPGGPISRYNTVECMRPNHILYLYSVKYQLRLALTMEIQNSCMHTNPKIKDLIQDAIDYNVGEDDSSIFISYNNLKIYPPKLLMYDQHYNALQKIITTTGNVLLMYSDIYS